MKVDWADMFAGLSLTAATIAVLTWVTGGAWQAILLLLALALTALGGFFAAILRPPAPAAEPEPISPRLFMPYSVCPKCDTEDLHWIESVEALRKTLRKNRRALYDGPIPDYKIDIWPLYLATPEGEAIKHNDDVLRTCRDCGHKWGQKLIMNLEADK
ncbi:gp204 [Mycobacterium phage Omega]|uniref:Uncharacterized protein n=1 Tax=Mycobacterium phage Omega TaxID=2907835 RepID=Q853W2_BPMOM|nr:gp204 [Mycobacterium phage Omega]AAN12846.1 hypothetical protein PBI_OMEGA_204 [Mycobacterium phage Omega]